MKCVFDLEANGLNHIKWDKKGNISAQVADKIWCGVFKEIDTNAKWRYRPVAGGSYEVGILDRMKSCDLLIGHNVIDYDLPLVERILDYKYEGEVFDTYIVSQMTMPDRPGGHGLDNWGKKLGRYKPAHEDWSKYSDEMLHRCTEDVEINYLVYLELLRELEGVPTINWFKG